MTFPLVAYCLVDSSLEIFFPYYVSYFTLIISVTSVTLVQPATVSLLKLSLLFFLIVPCSVGLLVHAVYVLCANVQFRVHVSELYTYVNTVKTFCRPLQIQPLNILSVIEFLPNMLHPSFSIFYFYI